ncbi:MAG: ParB/RepB/Spo0J family partition protein [Pseudomonadota bacterium]|nr:ParB/RepB/Spo0J family partition protein [Pseudomonadota bacterium]
MSRRPGLGRGLSALIGEANRPQQEDVQTVPSAGIVREISVGLIYPNPNQPRTSFDEAAIDELADSIRERGVISPILVRPVDGGYQLIAGERRWRAAQKAQLHAIPALIKELDDSSSAEVALIENIQREDLNAIEEAEGYRKLIDRHGHTQDQLGKLVAKSRSHVANLLRLLDLPADVRALLVSGAISMGHARAIIGAPDPSGIAREIIEGGLTVRQAEDRARAAKPTSGRIGGTSQPRPVDADLAALERQLGDLLGLKVKVAHAGKGGTVSLAYSSLDQLDMICQRLSGEPI